MVLLPNFNLWCTVHFSPTCHRKLKPKSYNAICPYMAYFFFPMEKNKVLLGESCECEPDNIVPSKAGLLTVLEVLKIQMKYWPNLSSSFEKLQLQRAMYSVEEKRKELFSNISHSPAVLINRTKGMYARGFLLCLFPLSQIRTYHIVRGWFLIIFH